jgi:predicted dehydrogenase
MKPLKVIQVGTGGFGAAWCDTFLPPNIKSGRFQVVAAVDIDPAALASARSVLGLPEEKCYTSAAKAFQENEADFCTIVVPPMFHEQIVNQALACNLDILSEKPIADTLPAAIRVSEKVLRAGRKMAVTMSHRFDQDKQSLRYYLRSGKYGRLDYLLYRVTANYREFASWGRFRHEIDDSLLIEGAVHHLDILSDLAGANAETVYAQTWKPDWADFAGHTQALITIRYKNGVHAFYEGALANAETMNSWGGDYIRAECEMATIELDRRSLISYSLCSTSDNKTVKQPLPLIEGDQWTHSLLIRQFAEWLDGGTAPETEVTKNLQSLGKVFAAIESSRRGQPVHVPTMLQETRQ